jgi:hypothetical protein
LFALRVNPLSKLFSVFSITTTPGATTIPG